MAATMERETLERLIEGVNLELVGDELRTNDGFDSVLVVRGDDSLILEAAVDWLASEVRAVEWR